MSENPNAAVPSQAVVQRSGGGRRRQGSVVLLAVIAIAVVQFLLVLMFAWSSSRAGPRSLPIAVAGPAQAARTLARGLELSQPGAFAVTVLDDDAAARAAVNDRRVYGAVSLTGAGARLYVASEASPNVAQMLVQAVPASLARVLPHVAVSVVDLAPNPVDDPKGTAIPTALIPLTMTSIAAGAVIGLRMGDRRRQLAALLGYAVLAGIFVTLALQGMIGGLTGSWLSNELVITLGAGSIAAVTCGLASLIRIAGILVTLLVAWFFGFAFSGATTAWQLMPAPWGHIAQYLPVGATNTGLRSVAFFDGAKAFGPLLVLGAWALVGIALTVLRQRPALVTARRDII
ncbi:MAG: ABC transporter permease [Acidimicrobiales bacterium]